METKKTTQFRILPAGPIEVTGDFRITGPDGKQIEASAPVYLCRCGGSSNKPFCDGTHRGIGFDK